MDGGIARCRMTQRRKDAAATRRRGKSGKPFGRMLLTTYLTLATVWVQQKGAVVLKRELIQRVADMNPHLRASDAQKIVNTIFEEMIAAMARGDRVELRGIGAFTVRMRRGRPGRNPRTGTNVAVPQRLHPHFKDGQANARKVECGLGRGKHSGCFVDGCSKNV